MVCVMIYMLRAIFFTNSLYSTVVSHQFFLTLSATLLHSTCVMGWDAISMSLKSGPCINLPPELHSYVLCILKHLKRLWHSDIAL